MSLNIEKLRRQAIKSFIPVGENLRREGAVDSEIVYVFNNHVEVKIKNYYSELKYCRSRISINLQDLKSADSKAEVVFYNKLCEEKIPFKFQYEISPYRVDFLISDFLIVEIDGPHHNETTQKKHDEKRDKYLKAYGYRVVRYPIWLIAMDIDAVIEQIKEDVSIKKQN